MQYPPRPNPKLELPCARRTDNLVSSADLLPHGAPPKPRQHQGPN